MASDKLDINPWVDIWLKPRQTIRSIVDHNPKYRFVLLAAIYGFPMALRLAQNLSLGQDFTLSAIIITALILAVFLGMIGISIASGLILWTGKWIGGRGSYYPIRAAVSWSNVPNIVTILTWILMIAVFKRDLFSENFVGTPFVGYELAVFTLIFLAQTTAAIWSFIILLKGIGEVQGFSAWKALLNVIIPFVIVVAAVWIVSAIIVWFQSQASMS